MNRLATIVAAGVFGLIFAQSAQAGLVFRLSPLSFSPSTGGQPGYAGGLGWVTTGASNGCQWSVLEVDFSSAYSGGDGDLLLTSTYLFGGMPAGIFWAGLRGGVSQTLGAGDPQALGAAVIRFTPADHKAYYESDIGVSGNGEVFVQLTLAVELL